jgi:hypothetical protein
MMMIRSSFVRLLPLNPSNSEKKLNRGHRRHRRVYLSSSPLHIYTSIYLPWNTVQRQEPTTMSSASRTTAILSKRLRTSSSRRALSTTSIVQNQSSSTSSSTWTRSLPEGSNPAYDASLVFLAQHSSSLLDKAERLRGKLSSVQDADLKSTIEIALKKTELEARIARPETRWLHENESVGHVGGEAEAGDKEALNVMAERRWRKMGKLDRLVSLDFLSLLL